MKTISQHPLVKMAPSRWSRLSDARRTFENKMAVRRHEQQEGRLPKAEVFPEDAYDENGFVHLPAVKA